MYVFTATADMSADGVYDVALNVTVANDSDTVTTTTQHKVRTNTLQVHQLQVETLFVLVIQLR